MWFSSAVLTGVCVFLSAVGEELIAVGILGTLLAIIVFFSGHPKEKGKLVLVFLLLPAHNLGIDLGFTFLGPYDFAVYFFLLWGLIVVAKEYEFKFPSHPLFSLVLVMLLLFTPSLANTESAESSLKESIRLLIVLTLAYVVFLALTRIKDERFVITILRIFVMETVVIALQSFVEAYFTSSGGVITTRVRSGLFVDVNYYSAYLITVISVAVGLMLTEKMKPWRYFYLFGIGVLILGVLLTLSRAGVLALAFLFLVFACYSIIHLRGVRKLTTAASILGFLIAVVVLMLSPVGGKFLDVVNIVARAEASVQGIDRSFIQRSEIVEIGVRAFEAHPFIGVGYGSFEKSFHRYRESQVDVGSERAAHNTPLRILAETGIIGFSGAFLFIVGLFFHIGRGMKRALNESWRTLLFSIGAGMAALMLMSLTLDMPVEPYFWTLVGVATAMISMPHADERIASR